MGLIPDWDAAINWVNERLNKKLVKSVNRFQTISHDLQNARKADVEVVALSEQGTIKEHFQQFLRNQRHVGRYDLLLHWSMQYLSELALPSSNSSLHDQLKVMLAASFGDYLEGEKAEQEDEFQLLLGDVSGIQSYLLSIAHVGAGGVAKQLRARSFYLSQMPKLAAHFILDELGLTARHILLVTGGVFLLCVRKADDISAIKKRMNEMLYEHHHGMLQLHLATETINYQQLGNIAPVLTELHARIRRSKQVPLSDVVQKHGAWIDEVEGVWLHERKAGVYCASCNQHPVIDASEELCMHCSRDLEIGGKLPTGIGMQVTKHASDQSNKRNNFVLWGKYELKLIQTADEVSRDAVMLEAWNEMSMVERISTLSNGWITSVYVTNYVPRTKENTIITFEEIALRSKGAKLLGVYKADLDHLGSLLSFGLRNEQLTYELAEYINASRTLDQFIGEQLTKTVVKNYPLVYTVFSGGDDLFLIGPWSDMLKFSIDMKQSFDRFTNNNPEVTISAAIVIATNRTPLSVLADQAEELLDLAKEVPSPFRQGKHGRNQLCLNGTLIEWSDVSIVNEHIDLWTDWEKTGKASHQFFRKLVEYSLMKQSYHQEGKIEGLRYHALLTYLINRLERYKYGELIHWVEGLQKSRLETESELYRLWCLIPVIYELFTYQRIER